MYLCEMTGAKFSSCSPWFSSAQNSFITKFLVNFRDKIRRAHTVLVTSKT